MIENCPRCAWCGAEVSEVYIDDDGDPCGCEYCVKVEYADGRLCEMCGLPCEYTYYHNGDVCGCDKCVKTTEKWEW